MFANQNSQFTKKPEDRLKISRQYLQVSADFALACEFAECHRDSSPDRQGIHQQVKSFADSL